MGAPQRWISSATCFTQGTCGSSFEARLLNARVAFTAYTASNESFSIDLQKSVRTQEPTQQVPTHEFLLSSRMASCTTLSLASCGDISTTDTRRLLACFSLR